MNRIRTLARPARPAASRLAVPWAALDSIGYVLEPGAFVWGAVAGATSYVLQVGSDTGLSELNLSSGATYYARVCAVVCGVQQPPGVESTVTL